MFDKYYLEKYAPKSNIVYNILMLPKPFISYRV